MKDRAMRDAREEQQELEALHRLDEECVQQQRAGNYLKAFDCMERALVLRRHFFGVDSDEVARACRALAEMCNLLAMSFLQQDNYAVTVDLLKKAEVLTQRHHPAERATTLNNFACYYRRLGKLHSAMTSLKRALELEKRMENVRNAADTQLNMCAVLSQLGKHQKALEHAQEALISLQEGFIQGKHVAETPTDGATAETSSTRLDRISVMCIAYHNIGVEQEFLKDYVESVASYKKGIGLAEQYLGADHSITTTIRNSYLAAKRTLATKARSPRSGSLRMSSPLAKEKDRHNISDIPTPRSIIAEALSRGPISALPPLEIKSPTSASKNKKKNAAGETKDASAQTLSPTDPLFSPRFRFENDTAESKRKKSHHAISPPVFDNLEISTPPSSKGTRERRKSSVKKPTTTAGASSRKSSRTKNAPAPLSNEEDLSVTAASSNKQRASVNETICNSSTALSTDIVSSEQSGPSSSDVVSKITPPADSDGSIDMELPLARGERHDRPTESEDHFEPAWEDSTQVQNMVAAVLSQVVDKLVENYTNLQRSGTDEEKDTAVVMTSNQEQPIETFNEAQTNDEDYSHVLEAESEDQLTNSGHESVMMEVIPDELSAVSRSDHEALVAESADLAGGEVSADESIAAATAQNDEIEHVEEHADDSLKVDTEETPALNDHTEVDAGDADEFTNEIPNGEMEMRADQDDTSYSKDTGVDEVGEVVPELNSEAIAHGHDMTSEIVDQQIPVEGSDNSATESVAYYHENVSLMDSGGPSFEVVEEHPLHSTEYFSDSSWQNNEDDHFADTHESAAHVTNNINDSVSTSVEYEENAVLGSYEDHYNAENYTPAENISPAEKDTEANEVFHDGPLAEEAVIVEYGATGYEMNEQTDHVTADYYEHQSHNEYGDTTSGVVEQDWSHADLGEHVALEDAVDYNYYSQEQGPVLSYEEQATEYSGEQLHETAGPEAVHDDAVDADTHDLAPSE